ncbi:MAG TPA: glyceraldehyde 3-phosphate dehydrogenase NAD-binding domain-containing protein, partial [Bacteroidales bacterium]|nr:glyceraldehyde 3-phosphate dehydrogenase NAD-binding domain-containing protein [Bacteroidales bacterium]
MRGWLALGLHTFAANTHAMIRIAINGFGRIGRVTLRNAFRAEDMEVVAVNDLADAATLAHLLRYDSVQGRFPAEVSHTAERLTVGEREVLVFSEPDPGKLPWKALGIDVVRVRKPPGVPV